MQAPRLTALAVAAGAGVVPLVFGLIVTDEPPGVVPLTLGVDESLDVMPPTVCAAAH